MGLAARPVRPAPLRSRRLVVLGRHRPPCGLRAADDVGAVVAHARRALLEPPVQAAQARDALRSAPAHLLRGAEPGPLHGAGHRRDRDEGPRLDELRRQPANEPAGRRRAPEDDGPLLLRRRGRDRRRVPPRDLRGGRGGSRRARGRPRPEGDSRRRAGERPAADRGGRGRAGPEHGVPPQRRGLRGDAERRGGGVRESRVERHGD